MSVIKFPPPPPPPGIIKRHKQVVSVREMYCQGNDMPDQMVWDMCRYTRRGVTNDNGDIYPACKECPRWEEDKDYGKVQRGCFGMAQEACRYALAWVERMNHGGPYD